MFANLFGEIFMSLMFLSCVNTDRSSYLANHKVEEKKLLYIVKVIQRAACEWKFFQLGSRLLSHYSALICECDKSTSNSMSAFKID